jgi:hypothetical protein
MSWQLVRLDPPERRGEILTLDDSLGRHRLGRSSECDLRLHTASASRQHALLRRREDGSWIIEAVADRPLLADGEPVEGECELCEGLALTLGGDRLRCRQVEAEAPAPSSSAEPSARRSLPLWSGLTGGAMLLMLLAIMTILRSGCGG